MVIVTKLGQNYSQSRMGQLRSGNFNFFGAFNNYGSNYKLWGLKSEANNEVAVITVMGQNDSSATTQDGLA